MHIYDSVQKTKLLFEPIKKGESMLGILFMLFFFMLTTVFFTACNSNHNSLTEEAEIYCKEHNGTIIKHTEYENQSIVKHCRYTEEAQFDDGVSTFTHQCELIAFYEDRCDEEATADFKDTNLILKSNNSLNRTFDSNDNLGEILYHGVAHLLLNIDNTGYSHNKNNNFSITPKPFKYPEPNNNDPYNLFLDCSGFVGYYVLQGVIKSLYDDLKKNSVYSCGRPLAADFADAIAKAPTHIPDAVQSDIENDNVCWKRIDNLADAKRGDIIVYKHSDNIGNETKQCKDGRTIKLAECKKYKDGKCIKRKNTGHVLYIHKAPYRSQHCKDKKSITGGSGCYSSKSYAKHTPGNFQWMVRVADSTTSRHSKDGRHVGAGNSHYSSNYYHAWTKDNNNISHSLYRCGDGSYHRNCDDHDGEEENIVINTNYLSHPTGVGTGYMYINDDRDGFRTKYYSDISDAEVYIGRPGKCKIPF